MASSPSNPSHVQFEVMVTKSMLKPTLQLTLPSRVVRGLQLNPLEDAEVWFTMYPTHNYVMVFKRQKYPQGGWRASKNAEWGKMVRAYRIIKGKRLTSTKMPYPGRYYVVRSPKLDEWNQSHGKYPQGFVFPFC